MAESFDTDENRRQSVRVSDKVLLTYEQISSDEYAAIVKDNNRGISPRKQKGSADIELFIGAQNALGRIRDKDEDLADFLQHIDAKISQILKTVKGSPSTFDELSLQEVSISGSGIGFYAKQPQQVGDIMECSMVLLPNYSYIHCFGNVIKCENIPDGPAGKPYRIAIKFCLLQEEDRERIIQHSFKLQSLALRHRRLERG